MAPIVLYIVLIIHTAKSFSYQPRQSSVYNIEDAQLLFDRFMQSYNKVYINEEEKANRFEIFKANILAINERNKQDNVNAINRFSDLSSEEFIRRFSGLRTDVNPTNFCEIINEHDLSLIDIPDEYDWRDKIDIVVKDQRECNACWAFAVTANVEAQYYIRYNRNIILSEQQLVDCDTRSQGCGAGHPVSAFGYLLQAGGQEPEEFYPYVGHNGTCTEEKGKMWARLARCYVFNLVSNENLIRTALVLYGPLVAALDPASYNTYDGGVIKDCENKNVNHSLLIVGYGTDRDTGVDFWTLKNSWSDSWGEGGYVRIPRGVNACGINNLYLSSSVVV